MAGNFNDISAKEIAWFIFGPVDLLDGLAAQEVAADYTAILDRRLANGHRVILHEELNDKEAGLSGFRNILPIALKSSSRHILLDQMSIEAQDDATLFSRARILLRWRTVQTNTAPEGILLRSEAVVGWNLTFDANLGSLSVAFERKIWFQVDAPGSKMLPRKVVAAGKKHGTAKNTNLFADGKVTPGVILAIFAAIIAGAAAARGNAVARLKTRLGQLASLEKLGKQFTTSIVLMDGENFKGPIGEVIQKTEALNIAIESLPIVPNCVEAQSVLSILQEGATVGHRRWFA